LQWIAFLTAAEKGMGAECSRENEKILSKTLHAKANAAAPAASNLNASFNQLF